MPQKKLFFQLTTGQLRSFQRHLEVVCGSKLNSDERNRLRNPKKDILYHPGGNLKKNFV